MDNTNTTNTMAPGVSTGTATPVSPVVPMPAAEEPVAPMASPMGMPEPMVGSAPMAAGTPDMPTPMASTAPTLTEPVMPTSETATSGTGMPAATGGVTNPMGQ